MTVFRLHSEETSREAKYNVTDSDTHQVSSCRDECQSKRMKYASVDESEEDTICRASVNNTASSINNRSHWTRVRGPGQTRSRLRCKPSPSFACTQTKRVVKDPTQNGEAAAGCSVPKCETESVAASESSPTAVAMPTRVTDYSAFVSLPAVDGVSQLPVSEHLTVISPESSQPISDPVTDAVMLDHPYAMAGLTRVTPDMLSCGALDDDVMRGVIARLTVVRSEPTSSHSVLSSVPPAVTENHHNFQTRNAASDRVQFTSGSNGHSSDGSSDELIIVNSDSALVSSTPGRKKSPSTSKYCREDTVIAKLEQLPATFRTDRSVSSSDTHRCPTDNVVALCKYSCVGGQLVTVPESHTTGQSSHCPNVTRAGNSIVASPQKTLCKANTFTENTGEPSCSSDVGIGHLRTTSQSSLSHPQLAVQLQDGCDDNSLDKDCKSEDEIPQRRKFPVHVKVYCVRPKHPASVGSGLDDHSRDNVTRSLKDLVHQFALGSSSGPVCGVLPADDATSLTCLNVNQRSHSPVLQVSSTTAFVDTGLTEPQSAVLKNGISFAVDNTDSCYSDRISDVDC
jgi:hypothetical protein